MRKVRKLVKISLLLTKFDSKSSSKMGWRTLTTYAKREIEELMDNRIVQRCHLAPTIVEVHWKHIKSENHLTEIH